MSWRNTASAEAQEALDTLLSTSIDLAVQNLQKSDSFIPFAVTVNAGQEHSLLSGAGRTRSRLLRLSSVNWLRRRTTSLRTPSRTTPTSPRWDLMPSRSVYSIAKALR